MRYFGLTDKGLIRKNNQDNYIVSYNTKKDVLIIVCDGIGGNKAGDVASYEAISFFSDIFSNNLGFNTINDAQEFLSENIELCNQRIYKTSLANPEYTGMGTTFVGILITKYFTLAFNVGDSRVYTYKNDHLNQITIDHNFSNELLSKGVMSKENVENHPKKNYLTRALGVQEKIAADYFEISDKPSYILVSSDGLHGYVSADAISQVLHDIKLSLAQKTNKLLDMALKAGGYDNITIVLVELLGDDYDN